MKKRLLCSVLTLAIVLTPISVDIKDRSEDKIGITIEKNTAYAASKKTVKLIRPQNFGVSLLNEDCEKVDESYNGTKYVYLTWTANTNEAVKGYYVLRTCEGTVKKISVGAKKGGKIYWKDKDANDGRKYSYRVVTKSNSKKISDSDPTEAKTITAPIVYTESQSINQTSGNCIFSDLSNSDFDETKYLDKSKYEISDTYKYHVHADNSVPDIVKALTGKALGTVFSHTFAKSESNTISAVFGSNKSLSEELTKINNNWKDLYFPSDMFGYDCDDIDFNEYFRLFGQGYDKDLFEEYVDKLGTSYAPLLPRAWSYKKDNKIYKCVFYSESIEDLATVMRGKKTKYDGYLQVTVCGENNKEADLYIALVSVTVKK